MLEFAMVVHSSSLADAETSPSAASQLGSPLPPISVPELTAIGGYSLPVGRMQPHTTGEAPVKEIPAEVAVSKPRDGYPEPLLSSVLRYILGGMSALVALLAGYAAIGATFSSNLLGVIAAMSICGLCLLGARSTILYVHG